MKTTIAALIIIMLIFTVTACGKKDDYVSIVIPELMFEGQTPENVIAGAAQRGIAAVHNDDGTYTYKMPKERHAEMMAMMTEQINAAFNEIINEDVYGGLVKEILHNNDFTQITLKVDGEAYETSPIASIMVYICGMQGIIYNNYNGTSDAKVYVDVVDADTGEILDSKIYPDDEL